MQFREWNETLGYIELFPSLLTEKPPNKSTAGSTLPFHPKAHIPVLVGNRTRTEYCACLPVWGIDQPTMNPLETPLWEVTNARKKESKHPERGNTITTFQEYTIHRHNNLNSRNPSSDFIHSLFWNLQLAQKLPQAAIVLKLPYTPFGHFGQLRATKEN